MLCCVINYHNYGIYYYAFCKSTKKREKEFGILIRELREIKEVVGTSETRVILLENLIQNEVRNDIEKVYINVMKELKQKE